jgi:hypothetical protein
MDASGQNLKFAARQLWRNPGFSATVILFVPPPSPSGLGWSAV